MKMEKTILPSSFVSYPHQKKSIAESIKSPKRIINILGNGLVVFPRVYATNKDTELIAKSINIKENDSFLELGCGCGAVSVYLSRKCRSGLATDISSQAVRNTLYNIKKLGITNLRVKKSDLFKNINEKFDVIVFNPPYSAYQARNMTEKMFWDTHNISKIEFFKKVKSYLKPDGRIYFGWADFKDLDVNLPLRLAKQHKLRIKRYFQTKHHKGFKLLVFEIIRVD